MVVAILRKYFLEAVARVERLKLKMCFTLLVLPGFMKIYIEGTHVSAHMYICPDFRLIFYHDPCCYPVCSLVFPVIRGEDIFFYLLCIFVLTMSFLMLGSFSKTMQMLLASASLLNLANLLPIFASHLFFSRLIGFLSLCM